MLEWVWVGSVWTVVSLGRGRRMQIKVDVLRANLQPE